MPDFDEELLSAYLDGEASAAERARVEAWLAEQPESRQLLEELRSLKTSLERLPRTRLPHDFADDVLRQAEREVLTGRSEDNGDTRQSVERAERQSGFSWQRLKRPVAWASLTLAAGLLLMVVDRQRHPPAAGRQVAMAPPGAAGDDGELSARRADELRDALPLGGGMAPEGADGPAAAEQASSAPNDRELPSADKPPRAGPEVNQPLSQGQMGGAKAGTARSAQEPMGEVEELDRGSYAERDGRRAGLGLGIESGDASFVTDQTLVVWCDVSPDKKYNERFRELLLSNRIAWNEEPAEDANLADETLSDTAKKDAVEKDTDGKSADKNIQQPTLKAEKPANVNEGLGATASSLEAGERGRNETSPRGLRQRQRRLVEAEQAAVEQNAELVLVEASEPQIAAVLKELDRDDEVFKSVDVEPADDAPRQQELQRYRRGAVASKAPAKENYGRPNKKVPAQPPAAPPPPAPAQAAGGAGQASQGGFAYNLRSQMNRLQQTAEERKLERVKQSEATRNADKRQATGVEEDRLQVLFVLRPVDDAKPAASAPAAGEKGPNQD
ncbi:MAG TPA: zf-HC2 domain-containing protein [Pirellulales bacterium]|nr:zf-HC2 domain-containing protein [Pirellulales bacterium]